ncbi:hypothetical protein BH09ACT3_BH09ACT3_10730 [soil metagenome]
MGNVWRTRAVALGASVALAIGLSACSTVGVNTDSPEMKALRADTTEHVNLVTSMTIPVNMRRIAASVIDSCGQIDPDQGAVVGGATYCAISRADVLAVNVPGDAVANAKAVDVLFDTSGFESDFSLAESPEVAEMNSGGKVIASIVTEVLGIEVRAQFLPAGLPQELLALRLSSVPTHGGNILESSGTPAAERISSIADSDAPYFVILDYSEEYYSSVPR